MDSNALRVVVIANDPLARAGLTALLKNEPTLSVVGRLAGDDETLANLTVYRPDVLLLDLGWRTDHSAEQLVAWGDLALPLVALLPDESLAGDAWAAGISGLLLRNTGGTQLAAALQTAVQGLSVLAPVLAAALINTPALPPAVAPEPLTPRESEVLQLLAEGLPNKSIARRLGISDHTVKFHVNAILSKLDARSRTEAVVKATQFGLVLL